MLLIIVYSPFTHLRFSQRQIFAEPSALNSPLAAEACGLPKHYSFDVPFERKDGFRKIAPTTI